MDLLGGLLGALLTGAVVLGLLRLRPAPARGLGALGWPAGAFAALWPLLTWASPDPIDPLTVGFSNLFLILGLRDLLGRRLPPEQGGEVSLGIAVGVLLSLLPALVAAELAGRRERRAEAERS